MPARNEVSSGYSVNSLERGLAILRAVREADGPVHNAEIVLRTGLPKATVSRLMGTLTAIGYLRRVSSHGTYVLGEASSRLGRAMLAALRLERYLRHFSELLCEANAFACLEARIAGGMVSVFRWSGT